MALTNLNVTVGVERRIKLVTIPANTAALDGETFTVSPDGAATVLADAATDTVAITALVAGDLTLTGNYAGFSKSVTLTAGEPVPPVTDIDFVDADAPAPIV